MPPNGPSFTIGLTPEAYLQPRIAVRIPFGLQWFILAIRSESAGCVALYGKQWYKCEFKYWPPVQSAHGPGSALLMSRGAHLDLHIHRLAIWAHASASAQGPVTLRRERDLIDASTRAAKPEREEVASHVEVVVKPRTSSASLGSSGNGDPSLSPSRSRMAYGAVRRNEAFASVVAPRMTCSTALGSYRDRGVLTVVSPPVNTPILRNRFSCSVRP